MFCGFQGCVELFQVSGVYEREWKLVLIIIISSCVELSEVKCQHWTRFVFMSFTIAEKTTQYNLDNVCK